MGQSLGNQKVSKVHGWQDHRENYLKELAFK